MTKFAREGLKIRNLPDQILPSIIFFLLLCSTWARIPIAVSFSTSGTTEVWIYDFVAMFMAVYIFVRLYRRQQSCQQDRLSVVLLVCAVILLLYYIFLMAFRYSQKQSVAGGFLVIRVILFSLVVYFAIANKVFSAKSVIVGILSWVSLINLLQVIMLLLFNIPVRSSVIISNISVYNAFVTMLIPLFAYVVSTANQYGRTRRIVLYALIGSNYLIAMNLVCFSGSRMAFGVYCIVSLLSLLIFPARVNLRIFVKCAAVGATLTAWFICLWVANLPLISEGINRSLYYPISIINAITNNTTLNDPEWLYENGSDDIDNNQVGQTVDISNDVRGAIQQEAIDQIRKHPWTGIGRPNVYAERYGNYQSAHNFLLEYALCFGLPGLAICLTLLLIPLYYFLFRTKLSFKIKVMILLIYSAVLLFSFVQPLITTKYTISVILWAMVGLVAQHSHASDIASETNTGSKIDGKKNI